MSPVSYPILIIPFFYFVGNLTIFYGRNPIQPNLSPTIGRPSNHSPTTQLLQSLFRKKTCSWVIYPDVSTCDWPGFQKSGYWFWKCGLELFNTRCGCNFFFCPDFDSLATCVSFMLFLQIEISIFCVNFLWNKQPPVCSMAIYSPQKFGKKCNYIKSWTIHFKGYSINGMFSCSVV